MFPTPPLSPSSPSSVSAKVSCLGANKLATNTFWVISMTFIEQINNHPYQVGIKRGQWLKGTKATAAVFPRVSKRRNSNNDDARRGGAPQHYVEGTNHVLHMGWI